ncbi:MAG: hypothetical protein M1300_00940 [Epsilonproteobacteria bacterium]|nr:hypothetical protein [Campylobacterota bacterium]
MKQSYEYLFAGVILGFSISLLFISFFTLNLDVLKVLAFIIPFGAFLFAIAKYVEELHYKKQKDTYEFYEKVIYEKFTDLTNKIGDRFKYREYFLSLSTEERLLHKQDLKKIELLLHLLSSKIKNDVLDGNIIKSVFNETSKQMFLSLLVHYQLSFLSRPAVVFEIYEYLYDDIDEFNKKADIQLREINDYLNTIGKNSMKVSVDNSVKSVEEWLAFVTDKTNSCIDREEVLDILQTIKFVYPTSEIYSNIGLVYAKCFDDHTIALKYFQKSYLLNKKNIYAYSGAMVSNFRINKKVDLAFMELKSMNPDLLEDDFILRNKIGLLLEFGDKNRAAILLEKVKDHNLKEAIVKKLNE